MLIVILFSISFSVSAQMYVTIRPNIPIIVKTSPPESNYIWIDEEWEPYNANYIYVGDHWEAPPNYGSNCNYGHWKHDKKRDNCLG